MKPWFFYPGNASQTLYKGKQIASPVPQHIPSPLSPDYPFQLHRIPLGEDGSHASLRVRNHLCRIHAQEPDDLFPERGVFGHAVHDDALDASDLEPPEMVHPLRVQQHRVSTGHEVRSGPR